MATLDGGLRHLVVEVTLIVNRTVVSREVYLVFRRRPHKLAPRLCGIGNKRARRHRDRHCQGDGDRSARRHQRPGQTGQACVHGRALRSAAPPSYNRGGGGTPCKTSFHDSTGPADAGGPSLLLWPWPILTVLGVGFLIYRIRTVEARLS
jgi:hypothetical protein